MNIDTFKNTYWRKTELIALCKNVSHYKNDAATREFFIKHIGKHFHYNHYLRQFTDKKNIPMNLTYGDLVDGWIKEEAQKEDPTHKTTIDKQFEYNQFTRDFFAHEKGKTRADAIKAWESVKAVPGPNTYQHYRAILT